MDHPPADNELLRLLISEVAHHTSKWELIAIYLDIAPAVVEQIAKSNHNIQDCFREVFSIWQRRRKPAFELSTMVDILDQIEEHHLAELLRVL